MLKDNSVKKHSDNGMSFIEDTKYRPKIFDLKDGEFRLWHSEGHTLINERDIDDIIKLLQIVKEKGYRIS